MQVAITSLTQCFKLFRPSNRPCTFFLGVASQAVASSQRSTSPWFFFIGKKHTAETVSMYARTFFLMSYECCNASIWSIWSIYDLPVKTKGNWDDISKGSIGFYRGLLASMYFVKTTSTHETTQNHRQNSINQSVHKAWNDIILPACKTPMTMLTMSTKVVCSFFWEEIKIGTSKLSFEVILEGWG